RDARVRRRTRLPRPPRRLRPHGVPRRSRRYGQGRMAVRNERGAGLRRAALRRVGVAALVVAAGLAVAAVATWPALRDARTDFLASGARDATKAGRGEAAPGDHLQSNYRLWLVGHQLGERRQPWVDPSSFQPE